MDFQSGTGASPKVSPVPLSFSGHERLSILLAPFRIQAAPHQFAHGFCPAPDSILKPPIIDRPEIAGRYQ